LIFELTLLTHQFSRKLNFDLACQVATDAVAKNIANWNVLSNFFGHFFKYPVPATKTN